MMRAIMGTPEIVQRMRDAVHADRQHAGIGEDHFVQIRRRRIAVEGRLHVAHQQRADLRQPAQKDLRQFMRPRRALAELRPLASRSRP